MQKKYWFLILVPFIFILSFIFDKLILSLFVNSRNFYVDKILILIDIGLSEFILFVFLTLLFFFKEDIKKYLPLLWITMLTAAIIAFILKNLIHRQRPLDMALVSASSYSFPSGHATVAFSALPLIQRVFKKIKVFWIILAIIIALSRVYLGVHYLSDVIAGIIIGYLDGLIMVKLEKKYKIFSRLFN